MAKKVEYSVEERLRALYDLQLIDSRIDKIRSVRGELPLEVEDLEDEVSGLGVRIEKIEAELEEFENGIKDKLNKIEESKALIKKYNDLSPKFIFLYPTLNFRNNEIGAVIGINQLKSLNKKEGVITVSIDPSLPKKLRSIIPSLKKD